MSLTSALIEPALKWLARVGLVKQAGDLLIKSSRFSCGTEIYLNEELI